MQISDIIKGIESFQRDWETIGNLKVNDKLQINRYSEVKISESGIFQALSRTANKLFSDNKADAQSTYYWIDDFRIQTHELIHKLLENITKDPKVNPEIVHKAIICLADLQRSLHSAGLGIENLVDTYQWKNVALGSMTEILREEITLIKKLELTDIPAALTSLETTNNNLIMNLETKHDLETKHNRVKENISILDELEQSSQAEKNSSQANEILNNLENQINKIDTNKLRKEIAHSSLVKYNNLTSAKLKEDLVKITSTSLKLIDTDDGEEKSNITTFRQVAVDLTRAKQIKLNGEIVSSRLLPRDKEYNSAPAAFKKISQALGDKSEDLVLTGVVASLLTQKRVQDIISTYFKKFTESGETIISAKDFQYDLYIGNEINDEIKVEIKGHIHIEPFEDAQMHADDAQMHAFFKREITFPLSQLIKALNENDPSRLTDLKVTDDIGEVIHFPPALSRNMHPFIDTL